MVKARMLQSLEDGKNIGKESSNYESRKSLEKISNVISTYMRESIVYLKNTIVDLCIRDPLVFESR